MDKKDLPNKQSTNNERLSFLRKDGFYVILFLCLCIVAGVATYVNTKPKNRNSALVKNQTNITAKDITKTNNSKTAKDNDTEKTQMDNANLVKKDLNKNTASVQTNAQVVEKMVKPVSGTIVQGYTGTDGSMAIGVDKVSRTILGVYVKANKGVPVFAAINGNVESIDSGKIVIISKDNKLKTIYDNLDPASITLKKGAAVTQNTKLGVIGDSDYAKDRIVDCDHLYFEVDERQSDGKTYKDVNPQSYIKF